MLNVMHEACLAGFAVGVLNHEILVDVARLVRRHDAALDDVVGLAVVLISDGVDAVVGFLPVFGLKFFDAGIGLDGGNGGYHWRGVPIVIAARCGEGCEKHCRDI